jgi:hypothetical protein
MLACLLATAAVVALGACGGDSFEGGSGDAGDGGGDGGRDVGGGGTGNTSGSSTGGTGGEGGGPPELPTCTDQYGTAPGFELCSETALECRFAAKLDMLSCSDACRNRGGECVQAYKSATEDACTIAAATDCTDSQAFAVVCLCTVGCGGNPPCGVDQTCAADVRRRRLQLTRSTKIAPRHDVAARRSFRPHHIPR